MPFIRDFIGQPLQWKRPRLFTNSYELRASDQVLATISRSGVFKERTLAEAEGRQWVFTRVGFSRKKIVVYAGEFVDKSLKVLDPAAEVASIKRNWRGHGELIFRDGRSYRWTHTGFLRRVWSWTDAYNMPLMTLKSHKTLEISPAASDLPDLALFTLLGIYIMLIMEEEAAAAAAASSAGSF
jgi:hypothetical protein